MTHDLDIIRRCIQSFEFEKLFNQLGWDHHHGHLSVPVDGNEFALTAIAHKKGFQVFECRMPAGETFPLSTTCNKIQRQVAKSAHENIIIFTDEKQSRQSWKWAKREQGRILKSRGSDFYKGQSGEALAQRLVNLAVTLDEEEEISLVDITQRVRATFDVDRVTKRFYERFKKEHTAFLKFVEGIKERTSREWYASLMLNRLMFVYFIQKKGFLAGDLDYLRKRLEATKKVKGRDKFHTFYRYFLLRLFHEGFGQRETDRTADLEELLGKVPYLNGGLFDVHELEHENPKIQIADKAFERLFAFFEEFQWHLDDRPLRKDTEINPDVLGYIFEKYINQKQMGAYYTKEDITEYISKNTVIPYLFDATEKRCAVAFHSDSEIWQLLRENPDRYIYDAVGHGIFVNIHTGKQLDKPVPLPNEISAGIDDVSKRDGWNKAAPPELALPTETWREHVARRQRCEELRKKLRKGEVKSINDLVTCNLNISQFAQDVIDNCEGSDLLRSFYHVIAGRLPQRSNETFQSGISILDPTCGSGAFLFAALNILQPLYEGCLERMETFVAESDSVVPKTPEEEVDELIACGESKWLEFKSTARFDVKTGQNIGKLDKAKQNEILRKLDKDRQRDILKAVSAMLNTEGGDLLIGVQDDGSGFGIEHDYEFFDKKKRNRDAYELWLTNLFVENFGKIVTQCTRVSFAQRDGVDVCRVAVDPAPEPAYLKDGNAKQLYVRMGNQSRDLDIDEIIKYHKTRFEGPPPPKRNSPPPATAKPKGKQKHKVFRRILEDVGKHPNRDYFILKSIIINNLFGVDIMPEAVEICKLRLFLKLVSQIENVADLEPLPDIDFNIRAGNTLVGFVSLDQIRQAAKREQSGQSRIVFGDVEDEIKRIEEDAEVVDRNFKMFRRQQTQLGGAVTAEHKTELRESLCKLTDELDGYLAGEYGIDSKRSKDLSGWLTSHQPFHWFAEFFGIMAEGGFDVIIGNPPYIVYPSAKVKYGLEQMAFSTLATKNLYGFVFERSIQLAKNSGPVGLIVQLTVLSSGRQAKLQDLLRNRCGLVALPFPRRPESMFDGVEMPVAILLSLPGIASRFHTARVGRMYTEERPCALQNASLEGHQLRIDDCRIAKIGTDTEQALYRKVSECSACLNDLTASDSNHLVYYQEACRYWLKASLGLPYFTRNGQKMVPPHGRTINFSSRKAAQFATCLLNSSLFYWYYTSFSDCEHVNDGLVRNMPIPANWNTPNWASLSKRLTESLKKNAYRKTINTAQGHVIKYDEMKAVFSKKIIDQIDDTLAELYGFSESDCEFIKHFDMKYRTAADDSDE